MFTLATPDVVKGFRLTTANDAEHRDPTRFAIYGASEALRFDSEAWEFIADGETGASTQRFSTSRVTFENSTTYSHYKLVFTELRDASVDS
jgi:hypothetical protein